MDLKVNIRARLERHARNAHVFGKSTLSGVIRRFKVLSAIIIVILPIYPSIGAFGFNPETAVGNYDESTILFAYDGDTEDTSMFSKESGFIKPNATLSDDRDLSGINRVTAYTVQSGESVAMIAAKFSVSVNSIVWANSFNQDTVLQPGQVIQVPPVSGVVYKVLPGDTVDMLAKKFKTDGSRILAQNRLAQGQELLIGQELVIPGGVRTPDPKPQQVAAAKTTSKPATALKPKKDKPVAAKVSTRAYAVKYTGNGRGFAWGNCTYYVANHKNVTWRGNANAWLRNAAAAGVPTGKTAAAGAIVSFSGYGYNPYYGHVGIVADIDGDDLIIRDMNYRRVGEVTIRRVSKNDPSIRGFIYTD